MYRTSTALIFQVGSGPGGKATFAKLGLPEPKKTKAGGMIPPPQKSEKRPQGKSATAARVAALDDRFAPSGLGGRFPLGEKSYAAAHIVAGLKAQQPVDLSSGAPVPLSIYLPARVKGACLCLCLCFRVHCQVAPRF